MQTKFKSFAHTYPWVIEQDQLTFKRPLQLTEFPKLIEVIKQQPTEYQLKLLKKTLAYREIITRSQHVQINPINRPFQPFILS